MELAHLTALQEERAKLEASLEKSRTLRSGLAERTKEFASMLAAVKIKNSELRIKNEEVYEFMLKSCFISATTNQPFLFLRPNLESANNQCFKVLSVRGSIAIGQFSWARKANC